MPNWNKVQLMGHLTRDVECRDAGSTTVGSFSLAVNHNYKTASGEKREEVAFIDCTAWGKQAETLAQYVGKGDALFVSGRLKQDTWEDKNTGAKRSKIGVVVEDFQFIPKGGKKDDDGPPKSKSVGSGKWPTKSSGSTPSVIDDEDIPFSM